MKIKYTSIVIACIIVLEIIGGYAAVNNFTIDTNPEARAAAEQYYYLLLATGIIFVLAAVLLWRRRQKIIAIFAVVVGICNALGALTYVIALPVAISMIAVVITLSILNFVDEKTRISQ